MPSYLTPGDVTLPGKFQSLWNFLGTPVQLSWIATASAKVDEICGLEEFGLLYQPNVTSNLTSTLFLDRATNVLFLHYKPLRVINSITVQPDDGPALDPYPCVPNTNIFLWKGQGFRYRAPTDSSAISNAWWRDFAFNEGDIVTVNFDYGYDSVPTIVKNATLQILSVMLSTLSENPAGAASLSESGASADFIGRTGIMNPLMVDAEDMLSPFKVNLGAG